MSIELLAPAGTIDSFYAAIEAGADAVYLGLDALNARLRAKNFTTRTLAYLLPYARKKNAKVYVTLNTLVKQQELPRACDMLHQLEQLGVDAVIVSDPGLIRIAKKYFPGLELHGSTQMFYHNSLAAISAKTLGLKRIILARELSLREIAAVTEKKEIEVEIFVHGALCYAFSGTCLASSYLGGSSGNRGRCTQVCRRSFFNTRSKNKGFYFSPNDFSAIDFIPEFKKIGVSSLKIEGRMKNENYVHTVVSAYRTVIDNPEQLDAAKEALRYDMGRTKTDFFLSGNYPKGIIKSQNFAGTGVFLGKIQNQRGKTIYISTDEHLETGDKLRIHPKNGYNGTREKVVAVERKGAVWAITIGSNEKYKAGDGLYMAAKKRLAVQVKKPQLNTARIPRLQQRWPHTSKIVRNAPKQPGNKQQKIYVQINDTRWSNLISGTRIDGLILRLSPNDIFRTLKNPSFMRSWKKSVIIALPIFLPEKQIGQWYKCISFARKRGIHSFLCNHISQKHLFSRSDRLIAGPSIWSLNTETQKLLSDAGFEKFCYSIEDDVLNIRGSINGNGIFTILTKVPLFMSRIKPAIKEGATLTDDLNNTFKTLENNELYYLLGEKPMALFHHRSKLRQRGISEFLIDLSFIEPRKSLWRNILMAYKNESKFPGSSLFNYKAGLK